MQASALTQPQRCCQSPQINPSCKSFILLVKPCFAPHRHIHPTCQAAPDHHSDTPLSPTPPYCSAPSPIPAPSPSQAAAPSPPWSLMGRMVAEDRIPLTPQMQQHLISSAAARLSGLSPPAFSAALSALTTLLPDLSPRLLTLRPQLVAELVGDTAGVAQRLIKFRTLFPDANVSYIVAARPSLLTAAEWPGVVAAASKLAVMFPEGGVGRLVTQQPLLLVEDVDDVVGELERLMPGVDVRLVLIRNPGVVTQVQRGAGRLGPGAEEVAAVGPLDWL